MRKNYYLKWTAFLMLVTALLGSCNDKMDEYYENLGNYLAGSAWEVLEKDGNYSTFLKGAELAGYGVMLQGRSIVTVLAPDDAAFAAYLANNGYSSIEDMAERVPDEFAVLMGYHLIQYSYTKEMIADQRFTAPPSPGSILIYQGIYNKFRTFAREPISLVTGYDSETGVEITAKAYNREKYIPVYSGYLFRSWGVYDRASYNYSYLYPGKELAISSIDDFNIVNAQVEEYAIPSDNGYVYKISEVLDVPSTLDKVLDDQANYSVYKKALDRFKVLTKNTELTDSYGSESDPIYTVNHLGGISNLGSEWPIDESGIVVVGNSTLAKNMTTLFAPTNATLQNYFTEFWEPGGYENLESVDLLALRRLLLGHQYLDGFTEGYDDVLNGTVFPDNIEKVQQSGYSGGMPIGITVGDVNQSSTKMASNGTLYGLNEGVLMVPGNFTNAFKAAYKYKDFSHFMELIETAGYGNISGMIRRIFIPDNELVLATPISPDATSASGGTMMSYYVNLPNIYGGSQLMYESGDNTVAVGVSSAVNFIAPHIATYNVTPLRSEAEGTVYRTLDTRGYIYVEGNTVISARGHNFGAEPLEFTYLETAEDGAVISKLEYGGSNLSSLIRETRSIKTDLLNNNPSAAGAATPATIKPFKTYVALADFNTATVRYGFAAGEDMMVFIPRDDIFQDAIDGGLVPPTPTSATGSDERIAEEAAVGKYVKRYYMSMTRSATVFNQMFPFPSAGVQGQLVSYATYQNLDGTFSYYSMTLTDTGTALTLTDPMNNVLNVTEFFPYIFTDGAVYVIDGLIGLPND